MSGNVDLGCRDTKRLSKCFHLKFVCQATEIDRNFGIAYSYIARVCNLVFSANCKTNSVYRMLMTLSARPYVKTRPRSLYATCSVLIARGTLCELYAQVSEVDGRHAQILLQTTMLILSHSWFILLATIHSIL